MAVDIARHEDFYAFEHFKWIKPLDGDVELTAFESQHSIFDFDWNLVVWWNAQFADAIRMMEHNKRYSPMENFSLDAIKRGLASEPDGGVELWKHIASRVPLTEMRCVDHLEVAIRHLVKVNKDIQGKPFVVYDAVTGTWKSEGETLRYGAAKTVGSLVDQIIGRLFAEAMNSAVDFLEELVTAVVPMPAQNPFRGMNRAQINAAMQQPTPEMMAWDAAQTRRRALLDKIKPIQEMQKSITRGKYAPIKNLLRTRLGVAMTEWDTDTDWLVLRDGAVNVKEVHDTREVRVHPHSPTHMSTMALEVGWSDAIRNAGKSEWEAGVEKVLPKTPVREYLQKRFGAALLGTPGVAGKSMVWQWGVGDTAKSTLQECIAGARGVFAPYSLVTSSDALVARQATQATAERFKAYARGKRFVIMSELKDGEILDQAIVKSVTGGETVEGTAKYQNAVSYFFTATLFMASNHAPTYAPGDTALSQRIHVVPFEHKLIVREKDPDGWAVAPPEHRADPYWATRVLESPQERAAILRWVLDGLIRFADEGAVPPEEMKIANEEFSAEADPVARLVRSLLGTEAGYEGAAWLKIYTDQEWSDLGRRERDGLSVYDAQNMVTARAVELGLADQRSVGADGRPVVSQKIVRAAMNMLHEMGGKKKKVTLDSTTNRTGWAFSRVGRPADESIQV